jgi:S-adenosylmethionine/arginine decarboxylase-like enzyme
MQEPLGRSMQFHSYALVGLLSHEQWQKFLVEVTRTIGMHPVGQPAVWDYPVNGAGGNGSTMVQPISDSFLAVDTWPDHRGAYLLICSCRQFNPRTLKELLRHWQLWVAGECGHSLRIPIEDLYHGKLSQENCVRGG